MRAHFWLRACFLFGPLMFRVLLGFLYGCRVVHVRGTRGASLCAAGACAERACRRPGDNVPCFAWPGNVLHIRRTREVPGTHAFMQGFRLLRVSNSALWGGAGRRARDVTRCMIFRQGTCGTKATMKSKRHNRFRISLTCISHSLFGKPWMLNV